MLKWIITSCFIALVFVARVNAQKTQPANAPAITAAIDSFATKHTAEKIFLHTDRVFYTNLDTIWFKAYVLNEQLEGSTLSGLMYIELINDTGRVVLQQSIPVVEGMGWGQLALDSSKIFEGDYTLRAYTNWMQNAGTESFFNKRIYIAESSYSKRFIQTETRFIKDSVEIAMKLFDDSGKPLRLKDFTVSIRDNARVLNTTKAQTDLEGAIRLKTKIPSVKTNRQLSIKLKSNNKEGKKINFPLPARAANADLQFMPEGGALVYGIYSKVAFKAIGEDGAGIDINGTVYDDLNNAVTSFRSVHKGMGYFMLKPITGKHYAARVILSDGNTKTYPLPEIKKEGVVLTITNIPARDSLIITAQSSRNATKSNTYALIAQSRERVCYASVLNFRNDSILSGKIAKSRFPSGISRFTLFTDEQLPVAERLIFINRDDQLHINIEPDKPQYNIGDSIVLGITVTDKQGPVQGSFSLAVTDDGQVKTSETKNITSYMLLQSELKGNIEAPDWYFSEDVQQKAAVLDNLLLTQGWVGYSWDNVFRNEEPKFRPEKALEVTGTAKRLNKPQAGLPVSLLSTKGGLLFSEAITDNAGRFTIKDLAPSDTPAYIIKVKDKKFKTFEATIEVDEFKPSTVSNVYNLLSVPWFVNADSTLLNFNKQALVQKKLTAAEIAGAGKILQAVVIKARKMIKGSKNLNGPGEADQVLDEEDIRKAGKNSLIYLLNKQIKGFGMRTKLYPPCNFCKPDVLRSYYGIFEKQAKFVIDGVQLDLFISPEDVVSEMSYLNFLNRTIMQFTAEDIKGIEILYNLKYTGKYQTAYDSQLFLKPICYDCVPPAYAEPVYVEITTWSGNGLFQRRNHGTYLYRPMAISWPKQFYKPKYPVANNEIYNLRSTVLWEPNIITNAEGHAKVTFYLKHKPTSYTTIIQGADLMGAVGMGMIKIPVK